MTASITLSRTETTGSEPLALAGAGFLPLTAISATVGSVATPLSAATTDATGAFSGVLTPPTLAAGVHAVVVTDGVSSPSANVTYVNPEASGTEIHEIQDSLNELAGTYGLEAQGAANVWAGTHGLDLVGALNHKNSSTGLEFNGVCQALASQPGWDAQRCLSKLAYSTT